MSSLLPAVIVPAFIPSPSQGVWHLGPLPLRAYAICILIGIFAGYWLGRRRWVARGGSPEVLADIIMWAVPFGLVGARIYHVITDAELYFGEGKHPIDALKIWHGGLGIWGAVGFGCLGAWIACRRHKVPFLAVADVMAPGIALAQVVGRFGNYFNQELFGRPTSHWWGLEIDPAHRPDGFADFGTFHPTFLYEAIWNLGVIALVILAGRRFKLGHGRAFALYVAGYTVGRAWIENLRIDTVNEFAGLRLNVWTSMIMFVLAVAFFILSARLKPGQEDLSTIPGATDPTAAADVTGTTAGDVPETDADPSPAEPSSTEPSTAAASSTKPSSTEPSPAAPSSTEPSPAAPSTTAPSSTEPSPTDFSPTTGASSNTAAGEPSSASSPAVADNPATDSTDAEPATDGSTPVLEETGPHSPVTEAEATKVDSTDGSRD